ncbi:MAG: glycosyltransferase family 8 protein [Gammaproteobacteria bacterium]|jgi:lipopolysaccharide biosynthesis glycosyltransferase
MNSKINVVLASDDNYAQHMGLVILSCLTKASQPERLSFFILSNNISEKNKNNIKNISQQFSASSLIIEPPTDIYNNIPKKRYGVANLFRLSIGTLLPASVHKVIYLDCDVLFYADIKDLWETELDDCTVGAVTNLGHQPVDRLGIEDGAYFNTGVLLINLDKWRKAQIGSQALEYMNNNINKLIFPDQDGLNVSLKDNWKQLPLRWNQQPAVYSMFSKKHFEKSLSYQDYYDAIHNPAIVHFLANNKPWHYLTYHPLKESYYDYISKSPWSDYRPVDYTFLNILRKWFSVEKNIKRLYRRSIIPARFKTLA